MSRLDRMENRSRCNPINDYGCDGSLLLTFAVDVEAETLIGSATGSDIGSDEEYGTSCTLVVSFGSLGCTDFIFCLIWRFAAFWARAIWRCRCFICFWT